MEGGILQLLSWKHFLKTSEFREERCVGVVYTSVPPPKTVMISAILASGFDLRHLVPADLVAEGAAILVLLAAAILVYRSVRERYLLVWIFGWLLYVIYHEALFLAVRGQHPRELTALAHGCFMVAVGCFISSVLVYTNARRYLPLIGLLCAVAIDVAVVRSLWFPGSHSLLVAVQLLYRAMTLIGAIRLALFSRGRRELGIWTLTIMLLFLHMDETLHSPHFINGLDTAVEIMLGLSMILVVLDDMRGRARRLALMTAITSAIAEATEPSAMLLIVLEKLRSHHRAKAAWFRVIDNNRLIIREQVGLSDSYRKERYELDMIDSYGARLLNERIAARLRVDALEDGPREAFEREGFDHLLLVPVAGKSQPLGILSLGITYRRSYTPDEMKFLTTTAHEIGIAIENLRMIEQVVRSQRQWASTFDSIDDRIFVHDADLTIMRVNRAMVRQLGKAISEVIGTSCASLSAKPISGCPYCQRLNSNAEGRDPVFGGYSLVSTSSYIEEGSAASGTVHVITDTTERRAAEERYRLLFEEAQEGVFVSTPQGRVIDCNQAFVKILGYQNRSEVLALDIASEIYQTPADREAASAAMQARGYLKNHEVVVRRKDGTSATLLENSFATRNANGEIERFQGFLVDITDKKRTEEEIRRRNRELAALNAIAVISTQSFDLDEILNITLRQVIELFGAETGSINVFDPGSRLLRRRAAWGHRTDVTTGEISFTLPDQVWEDLLKTRTEVITRADLSRMPKEVLAYLESEKIHSMLGVVMWSQENPVGVIGVSERTERDFSSIDQNLMVAIARQLATTIEKVRLYEETTRAYDHLRRTQEQLLQSEKMSAMGQLVSGVAHELNNPLTAILGYAQLLESEQLQDRARDFNQKLYRQAQRTHRLVQNLLSFARQRKPVKQHVDVKRVLEDTLALRDYDLKLNNIKVTRTYSDVGPVYGDPHQLEQVFLNVINNAADAMLEREKSGSIDVTLYGAGDGAIVEIHDSGPGIKEISKIFDPFYTTKRVGKGTGLGLSICYGIVKEHGGDILAFNHASGGAVFRIKLPFAVERRSSERTQKIEVPPDAALHGRVLLLEDEESILEFEHEVLTGAGAEVVMTTTGEEAVAKLQKETFDVVVMGASLPGGWQPSSIYKWLQENRPGLEKRMVLTMSHIDDPEARKFIETHGITVLAKPFEVTDLLRVIRNAKNGKSTAASTS
jgi:PAS domain S-box-containing protein